MKKCTLNDVKVVNNNTSIHDNKTMQEILHKYAIEFIEIPRKEINGTPVSASIVRQMISDKDIDGIKRLVPPSTFECIYEKK